MDVGNQKNRVPEHRLAHTETFPNGTALGRLMLAATDLVLTAAMREGIDGAIQERKLLAEAVAVTLDTDPEAAAELHSRIGHLAVDHVLDSLQRQRLAS